MGVRVIPETMIQHAKQILRLRSHHANKIDVPKGHFAVYVGDEDNNMKRFVVPISFLKQPMFQALLKRAEDEFGFHQPMGNHHLLIPCPVDHFLDLTSRITNN
ncbi:hypothetical protein HN51_010425 [Arachis hypogaea]|uniref:Uncharacterized protein n=1 Tax=Arachis hypogaea TaxID=3818 RepID=A0A445E342_ARAHY|nr:auxin-responsive protein SAUR21-like [Arachis hypogaea]QHO55518.1 Auxin-responsive protein [Arachis hypogaea]RYR69864.1 hypothetical protein Ahy_A03g016406 [Arachis hypogaea]